MIPHFVQTLPSGRDIRVSWPMDKARSAMAQIRASVLKHLIARDRERGIPESGQCYDWSGEEKGQGRFVVNPGLAALRHTGREMLDMISERWHEYCSHPRDPEESLLPISNKTFVAEEQAAAKHISPVVTDPPKRGRGRPRKNPRTE